MIKYLVVLGLCVENIILLYALVVCLWENAGLDDCSQNHYKSTPSQMIHPKILSNSFAFFFFFLLSLRFVILILF